MVSLFQLSTTVYRDLSEAEIPIQITDCISGFPFRFAPFKSRNTEKQIIGEDRFAEVFVDAPVEVCEQRDTKGLYSKARAGEILEFTGISSPYEPPHEPSLRVETERLSVQDGVDALVAYLKQIGVLE